MEKTNEEKIYLNVKEACAYLGITKRLMDNLTSKRRITYVLCGGRKFKRQWLDEYIEKNKIQSVVPSEEPKKVKLESYIKPENKIYSRVSSFNYRHPELAVETPLEAKRKYLEYGYIPTYIKKHNDLL